MLIRKIGILSFLILSLFGLYSCVEKYWPKIDEKYYDILVVHGMITDEPGPYTILLSGTSSVNNPNEIPLSGFNVEIRDNQGNSEVLTETESGTYKTSSGGIQGVAGRSYQLVIQSPDGTVYESKHERLNTKVPINQLYAEIEHKQDTSLYVDLVGYQFYVETESFSQDTTYLLWNIKQTYEYDANLPLAYLYYNRQFHAVRRPDSLTHCWKTENRPEIFTFKAEDVKGEKLDKLALHYVNTRTKELSIRYSVLVKQLTINRSAYIFWSSLEDLNTGDGSIYVQQPYQLRANIYNTKDPNDIILGYFIVAGSSSKRIYLNRPTEPFYYQTDCFIDTDGRNLYYSTAEDWPMFVTDGPKGRGVVERYCFDCREAGGRLEKPDFWIDR